MTHLFDAWDDIDPLLRQSPRIPLMLDFDGTLAPIVPRPEDARVPAATMSTLQALRNCPRVVLAIISGRGARDVQRLLGLSGVHYFGSHGRERIRSGSPAIQVDERGRAAIRSICEQMARLLAGVEGLDIEDKSVSAAVHYRNTRPEDRSRIATVVHEAVASVPSLRIAAGKMVYDITPADGVDKGTAALAMARETGGTPLYFGDDTTDESAFGALPPPAITVFVGPDSRSTVARYRVADPCQVGESLVRVLDVARS